MTAGILGGATLVFWEDPPEMAPLTRPGGPVTVSMLLAPRSGGGAAGAAVHLQF